MPGVGFNPLFIGALHWDSLDTSLSDGKDSYSHGPVSIPSSSGHIIGAGTRRVPKDTVEKFLTLFQSPLHRGTSPVISASALASKAAHCPPFQSPLHRGTSVIRTTMMVACIQSCFNPLFIGAHRSSQTRTQSSSMIKVWVFQSPLHRGTSVIGVMARQRRRLGNGFQSPLHRGTSVIGQRTLCVG